MGAQPGSADGGIAGRLAAPARRVALDRLPADWFHSVVVVRCRGARSLASDSAVPGKLRGAWGRQLSLTASEEALAGNACPWRPACAYDVFFRTQGHVTPALEIPKPYVIGLHGDGADLLVRLTVFGFATDWTEVAAEALVRACRDKLSLGRPLDVIDRAFWSEEGVFAGEAPTAVILAFETPMEIRDRSKQGAGEIARSPDHAFDLPKLVATLANRVSGLARWQDAAIDADFRGLKALAQTCRTHVLDRAPDRWRRFSRRQQQWIQVGGWRHLLMVEGDLAPLMPLLAIGEITHVGSHVSLGLGRYTLLVPR